MNNDIIEISTVTEEQKSNLKKLADFLMKVEPSKFNMSKYINSSKEPYFLRRENYMECGTRACAAGYGPLAGIEAKPNETWLAYTSRAFGAGSLWYNACPALYTWLFNSEWAYSDNTPTGAAQRIYFFLENGGIPVDYYKQMMA